MFQDFNQWSTKENKLWEPLVQLQKMNGEAYEQAVREWISFNADCMATITKYIQTQPRVKNPEDFMDTQMKFMKEQGEKFLECAKNMSKIYQNAFKDQQEWMQGNLPLKQKSSEKKDNH